MSRRIKRKRIRKWVRGTERLLRNIHTQKIPTKVENVRRKRTTTKEKSYLDWHPEYRKRDRNLLGEEQMSAKVER